MILKPTFSKALDPTFNNDVKPPLVMLSMNKTATPETAEIIFRGPQEERMREMQIQEEQNGKN